MHRFLCPRVYFYLGRRALRFVSPRATYFLHLATRSKAPPLAGPRAAMPCAIVVAPKKSRQRNALFLFLMSLSCEHRVVCFRLARRRGVSPKVRLGLLRIFTTTLSAGRGGRYETLVCREEQSKEEILKRNAVSLKTSFCFFLADQKEGPAGRRTAYGNTIESTGRTPRELRKRHESKNKQKIIFTPRSAAPQLGAFLRPGSPGRGRIPGR